VTLTARFDQEMTELLGADCPAKLGVAVSGGGDSVALLVLLTSWAGANNCTIFAATVDHGLRDGARQEADAVARQCEALGVGHEILQWQSWDGSGNLQDQARRARYRLIGDWAGGLGVADVALGHTLDDQAETVLMRLARGSGVDGLSAMAGARASGGMRWLRPLLGMRRDELRDFLRQRGVSWVEDPSNDDPGYDRVKVRAALDMLETLGIPRQGLADTAARLKSARDVLAQAAQNAARRMARIEAGAVVFDRGEFFALQPETRRRLLAHMLCWVAHGEYPPRNTALVGLEVAIAAGKTTTLHGCLISPAGKDCTVSREPGVVADTTADPGEIWDNRWRMTGPAQPGQAIRCTGENGLKSCPDWRSTGISRTTLIAAPAVWWGSTLVAAPLAGLANGWRAEMVAEKVTGENHFFTTILSH